MTKTCFILIAMNLIPCLQTIEAQSNDPAKTMILSEDFETTDAGKIPEGFKATGAVAVVDDAASSGKKSLRIEAAARGARRITLEGDKVNALGGTFWGRLYYKVQTPFPLPPSNGQSVVHSTIVAGTAISPLANDQIEVRMLDTVMNRQGMHQYIYNVQPKGRREFGRGSQYLYQYTNDWTLAEWFVDHATQTYRLYINGAEITGVAKNNGATNFTGTEIPEVFQSLSFGWNNYQPVENGFVMWIDDLALAKERIGPRMADAQSSVATNAAIRRPTPPTRLSTAPGTPALIAAGAKAEELAKSWQQKIPTTNDAAANPMQAEAGKNPPLLDGNYLIGPVYVRAPELTVNSNVPAGKVVQFTMDSTNSKFFNPGIARNVFGKVDPLNPKTLIVETHPIDYQRTITVYIPAQYVPGTAAPFIVTHDGPGLGRPDLSLAHVLDNLIAQKRVPAMIAIMIAHGGGDAQGSERGREYDTMSGQYAEFIEAEVLPLVQKNYGVTLTKNPDGRATMGGSSGGSAALIMAWYHPEWYHRVITYSGTYVNQQWPFNPETPGGAWDFHDKLIPQSERKPIRLWMEVGDHDNYNPNIMRDGMHDWVEANNRMAMVLKAKGYHYQYVFAVNAGHTDRDVRAQTLPEALEWVWQGYQADKQP